MDAQEITVGTWVRFQSNGRLVIGVVNYIDKRVGGFTYLITDAGEISLDSVLEARR